MLEFCGSRERTSEVTSAVEALGPVRMVGLVGTVGTVSTTRETWHEWSHRMDGKMLVVWRGYRSTNWP